MTPPSIHELRWCPACGWVNCRGSSHRVNNSECPGHPEPLVYVLGDTPLINEVFARMRSNDGRPTGEQIMAFFALGMRVLGETDPDDTLTYSDAEKLLIGAKTILGVP